MGDNSELQTHESHPSTASYAVSEDGVVDYDGFAGAFLNAEVVLGGVDSAFGLSLSNLGAKKSWEALVAKAPVLDLSQYQMESSSERLTGCDWKIFMEIYFDDYHVEPFHSGLSSWADCGKLTWLFEPCAQVQLVGESALSGGKSQAYEKLASLARQLGAPASGFAAAWAAVYPGTMVEWLAGGLAISSVSPMGPGQSINRVVFAYPKEWVEKCPEFVKAHQQAYWETAKEDDEIAQRMQAGKNALAARGCDERGPAHPHLEAGIVEFHNWLAKNPWDRQASASMAAYRKPLKT